MLAGQLLCRWKICALSQSSSQAIILFVYFYLLDKQIFSENFAFQRIGIVALFEFILTTFLAGTTAIIQVNIVVVMDIARVNYNT